MWKTKNHIEFSLAIVFSISLSYFVYNFYIKEENSQFLEHAQAKLLISEAKSKRAIENKLNDQDELNAKECFNSTLQDAGFKVLSITKENNKLIAIVNKNEEAKEALNNTLNGVKFINAKENMEIQWSFMETSNNNSPINIEKKLQLNAISFFSKNDWQVWIDGKLYDQNNKKIDENAFISYVDENKIIINKNGKEIKSEL